MVLRGPGGSPGSHIFRNRAEGPVSPTPHPQLSGSLLRAAPGLFLQCPEAWPADGDAGLGSWGSTLGAAQAGGYWPFVLALRPARRAGEEGHGAGAQLGSAMGGLLQALRLEHSSRNARGHPPPTPEVSGRNLKGGYREQGWARRQGGG